MPINPMSRGATMYEGGNQALQNTLARNKAAQAETDANRRAVEDRASQQQFTANKLKAEQMALSQSEMMQGMQGVSRTVQDTSMRQDFPGDEGGPASSSRTASTRGAVNGGFGGAPTGPSIDGRYMSLVEAPKPQLDESKHPEVTMPTQGFMPPDAKAWQDAAFSRLQDRAGQMGASAQGSLANQLAGRGISGASGTFARGTAQNIMNTVQPLSDLNVEHLGQEYGAAENALNRTAQTNNAIFQGGITQRSQNIASQQALNSLKAQLAQLGYSGQIQQRGQDLDALYRMMDRP